MFPFAWRTFHHKPALVAPIILWLEYFLCAHHTNFPKFQLLGTCADPPGPAFFAYLALHGLCTTLRTLLHTSMHLHAPPHTSAHLCAPFHTPLCTSMHLCAPLHNFCASLSRASHPDRTFHFDLGPLCLPGATQPYSNSAQCP